MELLFIHALIFQYVKSHVFLGKYYIFKFKINTNNVKNKFSKSTILV